MGVPNKRWGRREKRASKTKEELQWMRKGVIFYFFILKEKVHRQMSYEEASTPNSNCLFCPMERWKRKMMQSKRGEEDKRESTPHSLHSLTNYIIIIIIIIYDYGRLELDGPFAFLCPSYTNQIIPFLFRTSPPPSFFLSLFNPPPFFLPLLVFAMTTLPLCLPPSSLIPPLPPSTHLSLIPLSIPFTRVLELFSSSFYY